MWLVGVAASEVDLEREQRERNEVMLLARLGGYRPGQGHHAVLHLRHDRLGIGERELVQDLPGVVGDLGISIQSRQPVATLLGAAHESLPAYVAAVRAAVARSCDSADRSIRSGVFSPDDTSRYTGLIDSLVVQDPFRMGYDGVKTALAASRGEGRAGAPATAPGRSAAVSAALSAASTLVVTAARGDCWLEVHAGAADGDVLYQGILAKGDARTFSGKALWIRAGAAEKLEMTLNGRRVDNVPRGTADVLVTSRGVRPATS